MRQIAALIDGPLPRVLVFLSALLMFGFGVELAFSDKAAGATAVLGAGILCLIFVFLPSFIRR